MWFCVFLRCAVSSPGDSSSGQQAMIALTKTLLCVYGDGRSLYKSTRHAPERHRCSCDWDRFSFCASRTVLIGICMIYTPEHQCSCDWDRVIILRLYYPPPGVVQHAPMNEGNPIITDVHSLYMSCNTPLFLRQQAPRTNKHCPSI